MQGVGFRPFVFRHAVRLGLAGFVRNDSSGVLIEVQGSPDAIAELCRLLVEAAPPLALVTGVSTESVASVAGEAGPRTRGGAAPGFVITESSDDGTADVPVSVDTGTCAECLAEIDDPGDRRFGYPFTNCTNCGPRYTIVVSVPYDRPATTMAGFKMCDECQREYDDPGDRRFHAQPNACPRCGPSLSYMAPDGSVRFAGDAALAAAVDDLLGGGVVAIKGVGGFHLAVDATSSGAVGELRRRKARDDKPFAVMAPDLAGAGAMVDLSGPAEEVLTSPRRPIVLARRHRSGDPAG
ncbi:MAG TPA: acylphosphatase, partial [Acidimicrobiales bacterium]|nr:acylphosphatase [Acidimicrobiales bacterium]